MAKLSSAQKCGALSSRNFSGTGGGGSMKVQGKFVAALEVTATAAVLQSSGGAAPGDPMHPQGGNYEQARDEPRVLETVDEFFAIHVPGGQNSDGSVQKPTVLRQDRGRYRFAAVQSPRSSTAVSRLAEKFGRYGVTGGSSSVASENAAGGFGADDVEGDSAEFFGNFVGEFDAPFLEGEKMFRALDKAEKAAKDKKASRKKKAEKTLRTKTKIVPFSRFTKKYRSYYGDAMPVEMKLDEKKGADRKKGAEGKGGGWGVGGGWGFNWPF
ncbi:unnamed protein product [Amoebophrya sp. A120]|nr:unnamed protein product [Amoebophrya sp. A120]|eukprot:GSA120T00023541001.1